MTEPAEISFANVIDLCRERDVRLAYEIGAFVVLEACEAVLERPRIINAHDVRLSPDGSTRVAEGRSGDLGDASAAAAELLASVLVVAGQEVPSMLMHLVDVRVARDLGLPAYRDELEAALVPLNRAAARRVLARQLRELTRGGAGAVAAESAGREPSDAQGADADLDALLGYQAPQSAGESPMPTAPNEYRAGGSERFREPTVSAALSGPGPLPAPLGLPSTEGRDGAGEGQGRRTSRGAFALALFVVGALGVGAYVWLSLHP